MYISLPVAEEGEAVCTSQPYVGAKLAITKGGAMCKCQAESRNARRTDRQTHRQTGVLDPRRVHICINSSYSK